MLKRREKRDHAVAWEDITGSGQVKHESGNGEGKRWTTGCIKIGGWRVRTKRVVSPSKETGIAFENHKECKLGRSYSSVFRCSQIPLNSPGKNMSSIFKCLSTSVRIIYYCCQ